MDSSYKEIMAAKSALLETTSTRGWLVIQKFAETVLRDLERQALDEDDPVKRNNYIFDARGARKHWAELVRRINLAKSLEEATDDSFFELAM